MNKKSLTMTIVFEAESANYGEGVGNVSSLKKHVRGDGKTYTRISSQALKYNIIDGMLVEGSRIDNTPMQLAKSVIQFNFDTTIAESAQIDLFGCMSTKDSKIKSRAAVCRVLPAISLEEFQADLDFLTNKAMLDRYNRQNPGSELAGGNIAQSEIHKSYYSYTVCVDLDRVGVDEDGNEAISKEEKVNRVKALLYSIKMLQRDIKGRRENLSPLFVIGGVYSTKNPIFLNRVEVKNNNILVDMIDDARKITDEIEEDTICGCVKSKFANDEEIRNTLGAISIREFFDKLVENMEKAFEE